MQEHVNTEVIEEFLEGHNPQKYIVGIEATYHENFVNLIVNDPETGKRIEKHKFKPFLWVKEQALKMLFDGDRTRRLQAQQDFKIRVKKLKVTNNKGETPSRLNNGYKYLVQTEEGYNNILQFFRVGGVNPYPSEKDKAAGKDNRHLFITISPTEQFLIYSGKRLFKGFEDYNNLHRFQFDLETTGLDPRQSSIFQIGIKDNRGLEHVIEVKGNTDDERRNSERDAIRRFFFIVRQLAPDVIAGYNSENFDFNFFFVRCERLGLDIKEIAETLNPLSPIRRKSATLKLGGETEFYESTLMWGFNIIDIAHAVRRAAAINSEIKGWGLKYITKYSNVAKENRVYVPGNEIHSTWADEANKYAFNNQNGDYYKVTEERPLEEGYEVKSGAYIVQRYLIDDLWETEKIDEMYNQASFLLAKLVPSSYQRSSTMGTATLWRLLMLAWSYENGLGVPELQPKRDFTGGLSRLLEVGYAKDVIKLDYAALYPNEIITYDIFPDIDITGVMHGLLLYIADTRDKYKNMKNEFAEKGEHKKADFYDKKQLPLKILANSFFGSFGAPYLFPWGDTDSAEETTCRGRQHLRLMVKHFTETHGFRPLVGDSVTYDTPIYIKYPDGMIDIVPIQDIFDEITIDVHGQQRDFSKKNFEVLTNNGWKKINYVYRHKTNKKVFDIRTHDRHIRVTEDHSIFQNGVKVLPSKLEVGDKIDVYDIPKHNNLETMSLDKAWLLGLFIGDGSAIYGDRKQKYFSKRKNRLVEHNGKRSEWTINNQNLSLLEKAKTILKKEFDIDAPIKDYMVSSKTNKLKSHYTSLAKWFSENCYTSYREKKVPAVILNSTPEIKKVFLDGFVCADGNGFNIDENKSFYQKSLTCVGGLTYLLKSLNLNHNIGLKKYHYDKNLFGLTINTPNKNNLSDLDIIKWKEDFNVGEQYVYDISTEDGSFIGGVNGVSCSNTDGFNFAIPETVNEIKYVSTGKHRFTEKGKEYVGVDAVVSEFNDLYMDGRMGLDIDDVCKSTINFARKNYANAIIKKNKDGSTKIKQKLVGNTIKSAKLPTYIAEFLNEGIELLLDGKGYEFLNLYYDYVDKIYNCNIPLTKIASKSKVKMSVKDYKARAKKKNKAGNPLPKQAHMELVLKHEMNPDLGNLIYYVNVGTRKSHGDLKTITNKETGKKTIELNCQLVNNEIMERDGEILKQIEILNKEMNQLMVEFMEIDKEDDNSIMEYEDRVEMLEGEIEELEESLTKVDYNIAKYLAAFNKRINPLIVCFSPEIRKDILIEDPAKRQFFTKKQCELTAGEPFKGTDQDSYKALMTMEDKEIKFWTSVDKIPNDIDLDEWETLKADYFDRMEKLRLENIEKEKLRVIEVMERCETWDYELMRNDGYLPVELDYMVSLNDNGDLISRKYGVKVGDFNDIFKFEEDAKLRTEYYKTLPPDITPEEMYQKWEDMLMIMNHNKSLNYDEYGV